MQRLGRALRAGSIVANGAGGYGPAFPFGGTKQSGFGREGGRAGIEEFVWRKSVYVAPG